MLDKEQVIQKMNERGFVVHSYIGDNSILFLSDQIHNPNYKDIPARQKPAIINIVTNLEKDEYQCTYNIPGSINKLQTPWCGPILNDSHFDNIVSVFESQAKWMMRIC